MHEAVYRNHLSKELVLEMVNGELLRKENSPLKLPTSKAVLFASEAFRYTSMKIAFAYKS
jgi:hypothetical protein